jgi:PKD repeat protein
VTGIGNCLNLNLSIFVHQTSFMKQFYTFLLTLFTVAITSSGFASGGPDAYGYTWMTSLDAGGPAYNWIDITSRPGVQTVTGLADDNSAAAMINVGFNFHFYWSDYSQLKVGSNGWLSFNNVSNIASCFPSIPTAGTGDNILAPLMGDLNFTGVGNTGQVKYWSNNVDSCVISYINVPFWSVSAPGWVGSNSFQVILCAADSSITYQYGSLGGFSPNAACVDLVVGIENSTGNVGLQVHNDAMPPNNYAIKFDYPAVVLMSIQDPMASWNTNTENKAIFLPVGSAHTLNANYRNAGNTNVSTTISLAATVLDAASVTVHSGTGSLPSLATGDDTTYTYPNAWTPAAAGQYTFRSELTNAQDINPANNTNNTELDVVNVCAASMQLSYVTGNTPSASINWNGGANDDGAAVYYAPPVYPYTVSSLQFYISSNVSHGYIAQIYDDNGPNGTPGTLLFTQSVPSASVVSAAWNTVPVSTPVTLNDGGFYVSWIQGGTTVFLGAETTGPVSRRNYEILDGAWADYRENANRDVCIRATIDGYNGSPAAAFSSTINLSDVDFTDLSTGPGLSWAWDFGDGSSTSTDQNPSHTYAAAGTYTVCLTATNACANSQSCQTITVCAPLTTNYSSSLNNLTASFVTLSTATSWAWDFGDGNTSTDQNPVHTYATAGTYTVGLIASNGCGEADTLYQTITVCAPIAASYNWSVSDLTATFTDGSAGTAWTWDFGDGNTSTDQNPVHTYAAPGSNTVCLIVSNTCGDADTVCETVTICGIPAVGYTAVTNELDAQFTDVSTGTVDSWAWDFGDGTTSTSPSPAHTYPADGNYYVCLVVSNSCGEADTMCQNIPVCTTPSALFDQSADELTVTFTDQSSADVGSWDWNFGDGNTSQSQNPVHTYAAEGTYTACLIVTKSCGTADTLCQQVIVDQNGLAESPQLVLNGYPNPLHGGQAANSVFHIDFMSELQDAQLEITDLAGRIVRSERVSGKSVQTDVTHLPAGFYKIRIVDASGTGILTLVKQ